jgi:hypothetical protein
MVNHTSTPDLKSRPHEAMIVNQTKQVENLAATDQTELTLIRLNPPPPYLKDKNYFLYILHPS